MNDYSLKDQFLGMFQSIVAFLPNLLAGIALLLVGWLMAWLAKRIVIRIAIVLKLERYLTSFRWGEDFAKADIRHGFYSFLGSIVAAVVFLIFLENAFEAWHLKLLSKIIEKGIAVFPRILTASIAFGFGWFISLWTAKSVQRALLHEHVPGAALLARIVKAVLIVFFSAIALVELNIGPRIVLVGFSAFIMTVGACVVAVAVTLGKDALRQILVSMAQRNQSSNPQKPEQY